MSANERASVEGGEATDPAAYVAARGPALQRFAYLVTGSADDAADLVQDALMRALPRWEALVRRGTVEAYLRRSIVNASISRWRRDRRLVSVADPGPLMPAQVDAASDSALAWELCASLPTMQRAALVLRFHDDLAFAQVAEILGCTESTARSHVHRAVRALRDRLGSKEEIHD